MPSGALVHSTCRSEQAGSGLVGLLVDQVGGLLPEGGLEPPLLAHAAPPRRASRFASSCARPRSPSRRARFRRSRCRCVRRQQRGRAVRGVHVEPDAVLAAEAADGLEVVVADPCSWRTPRRRAPSAGGPPSWQRSSASPSARRHDALVLVDLERPPPPARRGRASPRCASPSSARTAAPARRACRPRRRSTPRERPPRARRAGRSGSASEPPCVSTPPAALRPADLLGHPLDHHAAPSRARPAPSRRSTSAG